MKRKIANLLICTVLSICAICMIAQAKEDNFVDINGLYDPVDFSFNGDKVSFDSLERECILFLASYEAGELVDAVCRPLELSYEYFEVFASELGLDITNADTVEAFILSDTYTLRPCCESKRISLLAEDARDAYLFVYNDGSMNNGLALSTNKGAPRDNIVSGWLFDNRGGTARSSISQTINGVTDISTPQGSALIREFNEISDAGITAEFSAVVVGEKNSIEFRDRDGEAAYKIRNNGNEWEILGADGEYAYLVDKDNVGSEKFRIVLDFMSGKSITYINDVNVGEHDLLSDNTVNFRFAIDEAGKGVIIPKKITMTANYGIYENFDTFGIEDVYGWTSSEGSLVSSGELVVPAESTVSKTFSPIGVKYAADMLAIFPENENVSIKIMNNNTPAVELSSKNGVLYANGEEIYNLTENMWYRLRVEADPGNKTADIIVNGRTLGTVKLRMSSPVNNFEITSESGNARFDDIRLFAVLDHEDYVPEPEAKADFSDWIVAINVCSLWRDDSQHYGWAYITPYDENRPVLGYYDEGSPESADWEIKYMVEHGIDVQAFCWYADVSTGPLKRPRLSHQLHEGYQLAKYDSYMKYCLIWEAASGNRFNSEQFRNYVIPYWFENYFLDENYFVIDNKPVLHVYAISSVVGDKMFGSVENAAAELAYLEEVAQQYGFDGMLYVSNGTIADLDALGIDAYAAYHWGATGYTYETNVERNIQLAEQAITDTNGSVYVIPTISVGYNDYAWRSYKEPLMEVEDYDACHNWVKDTYIPTYAQSGTWQEKMVWLSTWNEYGEGTYVMPAEDLHGFGYLDVLRSKYTDLGDNHTDSVPTAEQGKRIQYMYPQYARHLRRQGNFVSTGSAQEVIKTVALTSGKVSQAGVSNFTIADGMVSGTSNRTDFSLYFSDAENVDISGVDAIRVRIKVPNGSKMKFYYATETSPSLGEDKAVTVTANTNSINDYLFYLGNKDSFNGTLTKLRLDPTDGENVYFELYSVEFLNAREQLVINNCKINSVIDPEEMNGEMLFPYDPETGVNYIMHSFIHWNHDEKILTIEANDHKVVYTVGKSTFNVDGVEEDLGYKLYQKDGLPMISYKTLADALGYTFRKEDYSYIVETPEIDLYNSVINDDYWEFDNYDSHGFASNSSDLMVNDGYKRLDNTDTKNRDLNMTKAFEEGIPAAKYSSIEVHMKHAYSGNPGTLSVYFITNFDGTWNEKKRVGTRLGTNDSGEEYVTYTIDTSSNQNWYGLITSIRVDPFDAIGYAEIDYIKLVENPEYDEETAEDFFGIVNGNAQNTVINTFYPAGGATITIEADESEPGNYVYRVTGKRGKAWTYIQHNYPFENGNTYKVSFRARAIGDSDENEVDIRLKPNMQYPDDSASSGIHHELGTVILPSDGSWVYYEKEFTVLEMTQAKDRKFSCYADPPSDTTSASFEIDDIVLKCIV